MDRQKIKQILIILVCVVLTIIFFSYNIVICVDSSHYCWLASLIRDRNGAFANWDVARGIVFPLIIYILTGFIGKNVVSLQIGMFIAYVSMLISAYCIYRFIKKEYEINIILKIIIWLAAIFLLILNPLIFGYYHTILTEYVSMTACIVASYFVWKWIDIDFKESKLKYVMYTIYFAISTAFMWHLKQPYVLTILAPVLIGTILSIIKRFNWKNVLQRIITVLVCFITLFLSIQVWNFIIEKKVAKIDTTRTSEGFLSNQIVSGMTEYYALPRDEQYEKENIINNTKISQEDKEKIIEIKDGKSNEYKNFLLIECAPYRNLQESKQIKVIYTKDENLSIGEALNFLINTFIENPKSVLDGYYNNYLTTVGLYKAKTVGIGAYVTKEITLGETYENFYIACNIYRDMTNNLNVPEHYWAYIENYNGINRQIRILNVVMIKMIPYAIVTFKVFLLAAPILCIASFVKFIVLRVKKKEEKKVKIYEILTILYGYSFLNVLMYSTLGALIDRYAISSYVAVNLAILIHLIYLSTLVLNKIKIKITNKKLHSERRKDESTTNNTSI